MPTGVLLPPTRAILPQPPSAGPIRFRSLPQAATVEIKHIATAERIGKWIEQTGRTIETSSGLAKLVGAVQQKIKQSNLTLEDWASRFVTLFAIYIPWTFEAFRKDQHKYETVGRNLTTWTLTLYLTNLFKSETFGPNSFLLDPLMRDSGAVKNKALRFGNLKNWLQGRFGLPGDYYQLIESIARVRISERDRKRAFWAKLDRPQLEALKTRYDQLQKLASRTALEEAQFQLLPKFLNRLNVFSLLSQALIIGSLMYVVGKVAMDITHRFFSIHDHDFNPQALQKKHPAQTRFRQAVAPAGLTPPPYWAPWTTPGNRFSPAFRLPPPAGASAVALPLNPAGRPL